MPGVLHLVIRLSKSGWRLLGLGLVWILLTACASSNQTPTPTIIPLDRTVLAEQALAPATPFPSATPLPLPSSTPTPTPFTALSVEVTPEPTVGPEETAEPVQVEVITAAINVRQGPGLDRDVIRTAQRGETLPATGVTPNGFWLQVDLEDSAVGWITAQADYVRLQNGGLADLPVVEVASEAASPTRPASAVAPTAPSTGGQSSPGRLVFATRSGGDLYIVNLDGSGLRKLAGGVIDPVVSPDGTQVAFTRWDGDEWGAVYALNLADGVERVVASDILQPKSPTWSPDGQALVISFQHGGLRDPKEECRRFGLGERVRLPENARVTGTTYNGDKGQLIICFVQAEDLQWYLRRIEVATGEVEDLPSDLYSYNPTWDPHSPSRVIYDGPKGLMQFDMASLSQQSVSADVRDTAPVFSPDGQRLALTYRQHDHWEVYTLDLATGARQRLTKPPILAEPQYNSAAPAWSPDGSQLAFLTDRQGRWEIWVMASDGSAPRPLFDSALQTELGLDYAGVNERLLNWLE